MAPTAHVRVLNHWLTPERPRGLMLLGSNTPSPKKALSHIFRQVANATLKRPNTLPVIAEFGADGGIARVDVRRN